MKTAIYLWVVLSLLAGTLYGQSSGMEGKQWHVMESWGWGGGASTIVYKTEGLTEYNGQVYSRVWAAYGSQTVNWNETDCLLRQDSLGNIQFIGNSWNVTDSFTYEFNLGLGDAVGIGHEGNCAAQVVGIDSVEMLDGTMRKRLELKYEDESFGPYSAFWTEGIGSIYGILEPLFCIFDAGLTLICYFEDGEKVYEKNPNSGDCLITSPTSTREEAAAPSLARIFPNPSTGLVFVDTEHTLHQVQLWTAQGALLQNLPGNVREIDLSPYPAGIYFLRLMTKDGEVEVLRVVRN